MSALVSFSYSSCSGEEGNTVCPSAEAAFGLALQRLLTEAMEIGTLGFNRRVCPVHHLPDFLSEFNCFCRWRWRRCTSDGWSSCWWGRSSCRRRCCRGEEGGEEGGRRGVRGRRQFHLLVAFSLPQFWLFAISNIGTDALQQQPLTDHVVVAGHGFLFVRLSSQAGDALCNSTFSKAPSTSCFTDFGSTVTGNCAAWHA